MSSYDDEDDVQDPNATLFDVIISIVLPICLVFGFEVLYRDPLLDVSRSSVPELQDDLKGSGTATLLSWIGFFGSFEALIVYLIICFNILEKPNALYLVSSMASVYWMVHQIKSYYREERLYL